MRRNGPVIEIRNLTVDYWQEDRWVTVIEDLSLHVNPAETLGLVANRVAANQRRPMLPRFLSSRRALTLGHGGF